MRIHEIKPRNVKDHEIEHLPPYGDGILHRAANITHHV